MEILNILKFIIEHGQLFFITLGIIVVTQLIYLYFHRSLESFFLFFVHKILVFILITLFYIYNKEIDNYYMKIIFIYLTGTVLLYNISQFTIFHKKDKVIEIEEIFLGSEINLTLFILLIFYYFKIRL